MIPTREQIEKWKQDRSSCVSEVWLRAMRDEIDNLQKVYELTHDKWSIERRDSNKLRAAIISIGTEVGASVNESCTVDFLCEVEGEVRSVVGNLRSDLDRANTEAALARDALAKANQDHVMAKVTREANEAQIREQWDRIRAVTRQIIEVTGAPGPCSMEDAVGFIIAEVGRLRADLEIALAKASDPVREEDIKAWRDWALGDIADPDLYDDCFVLSRAEIDAAVSLMRSAGDGKALLRELRAWVADKAGMHLREGFGWFLNSAVERIDEMLARPAPVDKPAATPDDERRAMIGMARQFRETYYPHSAVMHASGDDGQELLIYTRGEYRNDLVWLIASFGNMTGSAPVEQPTDAKIKAMEEHFNVNYRSIHPVEQPAAAVPDHFPDAGKMVPDDTRELVAQLADAVVTLCDGQGFGVTLSEVQAIAAKLRGGA